MILKFIWKSQGVSNSQNNFEKKDIKIGGLRLHQNGELESSKFSFLDKKPSRSTL